MCQSEKGIPEILMNYSGSSRERTPSGHEKMSVTGAGRLRECNIIQCHTVCMEVEKNGIIFVKATVSRAVCL